MTMLPSSSRTIQRFLIPPLLACLAGCSLPFGPFASPGRIGEEVAFDSLGFESDSFALSSTKESQLKVFETLFVKEGGYDLPGDPDPVRLRAFFRDLRESYFIKAEGIDYTLVRRQYHTFTHAMDVMLAMHGLLRSGGAAYFSEREAGVLILAALGHDAAHSGVNNTFLINAKHPFVEEVGPESLQEKRTVKHVMTLLDKHEILVVKEGMAKDLQNEIVGARNMIEQAILWTDISRHKEQMKKITDLVAQINDSLAKARAKAGRAAEPRGAVAEDLALREEIHSALPEDTRVMLASFLLHVCDISNPGREWEICERWAGLVMNEFFSQGDLEKKLGLPVSMNCDRDKVLVPFAQIGFGKFVIRDLYELLSRTLHTGGNYLLENFEENQKKWKRIEEDVKAGGKSYLIKFEPPSRDGGWLWGEE